MSKLPCIITHHRERVKQLVGTQLLKEAAVAVLAVAAMQNRRKRARMPPTPPSPQPHPPLNMAVILILSSSTTITNQTKEGAESTRQRPNGVQGLAAATWVEGPPMVRGPTIQEVGTTLVEAKTPPTLKWTTSLPIIQEVAMPTKEQAPLRSQF